MIAGTLIRLLAFLLGSQKHFENGRLGTALGPHREDGLDMIEALGRIPWTMSCAQDWSPDLWKDQFFVVGW